MKNFKVYKDDYKRFLVCPKFMWLMRYRHLPEVQNWVKNHLTFLDKEQEQKFLSSFRYKEGAKANKELDIRVVNGIWFQQKVVDFFKKKYKMFFFDQAWIQNQEEKQPFTNKIIKSSEYNAYHEAYFCYEKYATRCDLIFKNAKGELDIYEIKGVNKIELKSRKEEFLNDLSYQYWILKKLNFKVKNIFILHFNQNYIFREKLEVNHLYNIEDRFNKDKIKNLDIEKKLIELWDFLQKDLNQIKDTLLLPLCKEKNSVKTAICTYLIPKIKYKYHWLHLYRMRRTDKAKMYYQNQCQSIDLRKINLNDFRLTYLQKRSIKVVQNLEPIIKNKNIVQEELKKYKFPIYFYDFETTPLAIPKFKNSSPWAQIPFQYSIHVLTDPKYDLSQKLNIQHLEFIINTRQDPRYSFVEQFLKDVKVFGKGIYVAYSASFEKSILKKLIQNLELTIFQNNEIMYVIENTIDLKDLFKNFNIYHKKFYGSLSIKKTLPALLPEITYDNLVIQNGGEASALYFNYINKVISQTEWNEQISHLKEYCALDTLAMLLIYDKVKQFLKN